MAREEPDPFNPRLEPYSKHGHSYRATILAYVITCCGIAFSFAPILMSSTQELHEIKSYMIYITQCLSGTYAAVLSLVAFWFVWKRKLLISKGLVLSLESNPSYSNAHLISSLMDHGHRNQANRHHLGHSSPIQIVLFGVGSVVYCIIHLLRRAVERSLGMNQLLKFGGLLVCCIVYTLFLRKYNGASIKNSSLFHYSLAVMIGGQAFGWISITFNVLWNLSGDNSTTSALNVTTDLQDVKHETKFNVELGLEITECVLEPFFVEFLTISTGCLIGLWNTMKSDLDSHFEYEENATQGIMENERAPLRDYGAILSAEGLPCSRQGIQSQKWLKFYSRIFLMVSVFSGVVNIIVSEMQPPGPFTKLLYPNFIPTNFRILFMQAMEVLIHAPLWVLTVISNYKLQNCTRGIPKTKSLKSSDYLLLFTSAVLYIYYFLKLVAVIAGFFVQSQLQTTTTVLSVLFWFLNIMQVWSQTELILTIHYVSRSCPSVLKSFKLPKFTLIYLIAINLSLWFQRSVSLAWAEHDPTFYHYFPDFVAIFGKHNTKMLLVLYLPTGIIYNFHSAVLAYEIFQKFKS